MDEKPMHPPQPSLTLPPEMDAVYVNLVRTSHSPAEMVFDFARMMPNQPQTHVLSRLMMSPVSAKLFQRALSDNLARYEASFGEIPIPRDSSLANDLFGSHNPA